MHELFFPDGSCPSDSILQRFLKIAESTVGKFWSAQSVSTVSFALSQLGACPLHHQLVAFQKHCNEVRQEGQEARTSLAQTST